MVEGVLALIMGLLLVVPAGAQPVVAQPGQPLVMDFENASLVDNRGQRDYDSPAGTPDLYTVHAPDVMTNGRVFETQVHNGGFGPVLDSSTSRNGTTSLRFDLRTPNDPGGANRRSEVWFEGSRNPSRDLNDVITDTQRVPFGQERWYGISFKLDSQYEQSSQWIVSQWFQNAPNSTTTGNPPLILSVVGEDTTGNGRKDDPTDQVFLSMLGGNNQESGGGVPDPTTFNTFDIGGSGQAGSAVDVDGGRRTGTPIERDKWYDVLVHYRFSSIDLEPATSTTPPFYQTNPDAFVEFFISEAGEDDYQLVGSVSDIHLGLANSGTTDPNNPNFGLALKAGVYSTATGGSTDNHTMWIDEVRSGFSLDEVDPKAYAIPEPTTLALLGLGGLSLVARGRRH